MSSIVDTAKKTPKKAWIAAIIIPGGLLGIATWISAKSVYRVFKRKHGRKT